MQPTASAQTAAAPSSRACASDCPGAAFVAEQRRGRQSQAVHHEVRGAAVIDGAVAVELETRSTRGVEIDEEKRDAGAVDGSPECSR